MDFLSIVKHQIETGQVQTLRAIALPDDDWIKGWDICDDEGRVDSVERLRARLKRRGTSIEEFKSLPVYKRNLERLPWLKDL